KEAAARLRRDNLTLEAVRKLTVRTSAGTRLGNVEDLILDGWRIAALELSDGLLQDIFQGRQTLSLSRQFRLEGEEIIVPPDTVPREPAPKGEWLHEQGY
ncbi:MAG TPA: PRC-barrel domain-containing protein, partial [Bacillota bacterium]|nr:PRC-barrel domain-containing protein [Bacillota bacterium]